MQAYYAYTACMQYTLRNIPKSLDQALRRRAQQEGKSLNEVTVEALLRAMGLLGEPVVQRDLDDIAGTWCEDPVAESAFADQRRIDEDLWR